MWHEIRNDDNILSFMEAMCYFHDSCIKEFKYLSGAYVDKTLAMYPINDQRVLNIIIQRQSKKLHMIEMRFEGVTCLKLFPTDDKYTCEIFEATLFFKDGYVFWSDSKDWCETNLISECGIMVCAKKLFWRSFDEYVGNEDFYTSQRK